MDGCIARVLAIFFQFQSVKSNMLFGCDLLHLQGNARRLLDKRWDSSTSLGKLSKLGLAPILWCIIFLLIVTYIHSVVIGIYPVNDINNQFYSAPSVIQHYNYLTWSPL